MSRSEQSGPLPSRGQWFTTTHWSVVLAAGEQSSPRAAEALECLCRTYYYPLYAYVRRQGYGGDEAQDLTQEFFARFLERNYLDSVDPTKGRFRSFLLASLKHFLCSERIRASAVKRGGGRTIVSLNDEAVESRYRLDAESTLPPDRAYELRWATTVMEQALRKLREEFLEAGKLKQFERLKPFMSAEPEEGEYAAAAADLNMSQNAVGVMVHRMRQRYGELVRTEIAHTVAHPTEIDEEMRYLFEVLTGSR